MEENSMIRKLLIVLVLSLATAAVWSLWNADESRRRYILHLVKQIPDLPGRYYI
jgi:hypothetical protein